ncbi:hypothetical protein ABBQ38_001968 [Trebouxia sp. C0009 RCD-2024]
MVRATASLAAKIGKGLATPAAPSTTTVGKSKDFFREVCRILPWVVSNYKLDELIGVRELRRNIAQQFQQHAKVTSPQVIVHPSGTVCSLVSKYTQYSPMQVVDILIYKGREELEVQQYITIPAEQKTEAIRAAAISPFMDRFYRNLDAYGRG